MGAVAFAFDLLVVAIYYTGLGMDASRRADLLVRESQLKALKSQVNPHLLFNSLNSIAALAGADAERAREMCVRLADFLRTSLKLGERAIIPLSEELELTRMYVGVEQVRFAGKLRFVEQVSKECGPMEVPSLAIQPLVENAVKHGVAMMAEGGEIRLEGYLNGPRLRLTVSNPFDPDAPMQQRTGIGLRNLRERVEAVYHGRAEMLIQPQEREYRVTLDLPARKTSEK
jgi:LytS/YehU family sensor histidine kinase